MLVINQDSPISLVLLVGLSLLLSYLLYAFNFPLIRLLEGYRFQSADIFQNGFSRHLEKHDWFVSSIRKFDITRSLMIEELGFDPHDDDSRPLSPEQAKRWGEINQTLSRLQQDFDYLYPNERTAVLPTKLGNVIRAFESYPGYRYGMDAVALWPRLVPVLRDSEFLAFVTQEKNAFDFLLNMLLVIPVLGLEAFFMQVYSLNILIAALVLLATATGTLILYSGVTVAAGQWGMTVRVAFDLHRHSLHKRLFLQPMANTRDDYLLWEQLSAFLLYRTGKGPFNGFQSTSQALSRKDDSRQ